MRDDGAINVSRPDLVLVLLLTDNASFTNLFSNIPTLNEIAISSLIK